MKQLYAIGPLSSSTSQVALRATTAGIRPEEVETALSLAKYAVPTTTNTDAPKALPVRLALFHTTTAGRILTHIAPNGGNYFAHTLLNVPATADAQLAIQTWGSPLWQRHEPHNSADLPELPYLPVSDQLDDANLKDWLQSPTRREALEFVLTALLSTPSTSRIFLAGSSQDVAQIVYAVTRALPQGLLDDFTFSTYEADPLSCSARLIGTDLPDESQDLPESCYAAPDTAFHLGTGRRGELTAEVPFARFAVEALANADFSGLDDLKATWQRLGLKEARQWDLVYRMARGTGVLTKSEASEALQHPPMAAWIATRADALKQFLEWALEDRDFATESFTRAAQALRQKTDTLNKVAQTVREEGFKALAASDLNRSANALEVILPMVAPSKANAIWGEILQQISDPSSLTWELRWYLLPRLVRSKQILGQAGVEPAVLPWLNVPAEKLGDLLALDLPKPYQLAAARLGLKEPELSPTYLTTLGAHPGLVLALLQPSDGLSPDTLTKFFEGLLQHAPQQPWLEDLLTHAGDYPADQLNKFFEAALSAGKVDAERLIRSQGSRLLELFAGQSGLDRVGTLFLANPPADLLHSSSLLNFLNQLKEEPLLTHELIHRIKQVQTLRAFLDRPTLAGENLAPVAAALQTTPPVVPSTAKGEVFDAVTTELIRQSGSDELQSQLETVLIHLGRVLANDEADLYENLLRAIRSRSEFAKHENFVPTFLALALGAAQAPELANKLDGLDSHAFAIAAEAAKRGGSTLLHVVDRRSETWPKQARTQWGFLSAAVRPRGFRGFLRAWGVYGLLK